MVCTPLGHEFLLLARVGLQAKEGPFDTLTAHHPKGKPVWDLED